jgi:SAM-dependent methyltransferase
MSDRLERERQFHDARFADDADARAADRFYAVNEASTAFFQAAIAQLSKGARVLDYGCGAGAYVALYAAGLGHSVTAIDISPVAVAQASRRAAYAGVANRITFRVMDAEALDFERDSFDLVCGLGVLHHLNLATALSEVARVTDRNGRAVFVEPLGHNPLINEYRRRTPEQRTPDEHPLVVGDFGTMRRFFTEVHVTYFHLFGLLSLPLHGHRPFRPVLRSLDRLDQVAFRWLPFLRRHAWMAGVLLASPSSGDAVEPDSR